MKRWLRKHIKGYMVRVMIYQAFNRLLIGATLALLWNRFSGIALGQPRFSWSFIVAGMFFAVLCWMTYLRMDGLRIPRMDKNPFHRRKKPIISSYGDMSDHMDDEIIQYEELESEEKDICLLVSNGVCMLAFFAASLLL